MNGAGQSPRRAVRILMYTAYFEPEYSGAALQALTLAGELRRRGHHVEFVTNRWPGLAETAVVDGYPVRRIEPGRLKDRRDLLTNIESDSLEEHRIGRDWDELREKAFDGMTRPEGRQAFDLNREPAAVRERYGMHPLGQNLLLARRMVEAGVRFITVNGWTGQAPGAGNGPPSSSWDMHGGSMGMGDAFGGGSYGMGWCLPRLDQALSALLGDLKDRGLMDDTLVVAMGEFGRSPTIATKGAPGRLHWPQCFSSIMAGCGVAGGAVYGSSDKKGGYPESDLVTPQDIHATVLHALGVPLHDNTMNNGLARPQFSTGRPIMPMFG